MPDSSTRSPEAPPSLTPSDARAIVEHMNGDHADALLLYCRAFSDAKDALRASMTSIDPLGFELNVVTPTGTRPVRLPFSAPVGGKAEARTALVALLAEARSKLSV